MDLHTVFVVHFVCASFPLCCCLWDQHTIFGLPSNSFPPICLSIDAVHFFLMKENLFFIELLRLVVYDSWAALFALVDRCLLLV